MTKKTIKNTISEELFLSLIIKRTKQILLITQYINKYIPNHNQLTRPLLGDLLSEATKLEEFLDAYGAHNNLKWCSLRSFIASFKLFSNVGYNLLHIKYSIPSYHLLPIKNDFVDTTEKTIDFISNIIAQTSASLIRQTKNLKIPIPEILFDKDFFNEELPSGKLPSNRKKHKVSSAEKTVVYLATAFLNLAEESDILLMNTKQCEYKSCIPDPISEERIRDLEEKFHNLQSLYDTYISNTNVESLDKNLPVLRGHISIIFHLLQTATAFIHYYERHMQNNTSKAIKKNNINIDSLELLEVLMTYSIHFSSQYLKKAQGLCYLMLKRYAKKGKIQVDVPRYRGFHVRPSKLISKIVNHYGSEVIMKIEKESYNASMTLDLFRANEKLNATKRCTIADELSKIQPSNKKNDLLGEALGIIHTLFKTHKLIIYERNLHLDEIEPLHDETIFQYINRCIKRLLAMGKIDIETRLKALFYGDKRILADIKLLAENGYGEDDFGNNIALPKQLQYLRK